MLGSSLSCVAQRRMQGNVRIDSQGEAHCQHGPDECAANAAARCAMVLLPAPRDTAPPAALAPFSCIFDSLLQGSHHAGMEAVTRDCLEGAGLSWPEVQRCADGEQGRELTAEARRDTEALSPHHTWVPWVTVNGQAINAGELSQAARIVKAVCDAYSGDKCVPRLDAVCRFFSVPSVVLRCCRARCSAVESKQSRKGCPDTFAKARHAPCLCCVCPAPVATHIATCRAAAGRADARNSRGSTQAVPPQTSVRTDSVRSPCRYIEGLVEARREE